MHLTVKDADGATVVRIDGNVDGLTADQLLQTMTEQIQAGHAKLVADCAELGYASSAGLRALLGSVKLARQHDGDLRLAALQKAVLKVLEVSGFTSILRQFPDVASAVASYSEESAD